VLTRIGKYEVQSEIGEGGFGRVYLAYDPSVDRRVAIKILNTQPCQEMLNQFRAEAKTTGNLSHKNIVTVYDFGEHQGIPFLVMELLEGENLDEAIRTRKQISLITKLQLLHQTAEGLHYAHEMGVIHRDVKPANIMLLPTGSVKIMDFGIANLVNWSITKQTSRNSITGTTRYMAPEQLAGAPADVQTDIFSFGLVCYECISGAHPFHSDGDTRVMFRTANAKAEPLNRICPDCPDALAATIDRAVAIDRDARYQSLEDVLLDFQPILLDARRKHAIGLMALMGKLTGGNEPEQARLLLKQVLEFDPSHEAARSLLEELLANDRKLTLRRKVDEYRAKGAERLRAKDYGGAIENFQNALRGDNSCEDARVGLEEARRLLERTRSCAKLLSSARREFASGNISESLLLVEEALRTDPENDQASELFRTLTIATAVAESQRHRSFKEFDAAEAALKGLQELSHETAALNELAAIRLDREIRDKKQKEFEDRCAILKNERAAANWAEALRIVSETRLDFPERERELEELTLEIREEQAAAKRARAVQDAIAKANRDLAESFFTAAIQTLESALKLYPRERTLLGLKDEACARLLESEIAESLRDEREAAAEWEQIQAQARELLILSPGQAVSRLLEASEKHGKRPDHSRLLQSAQSEADFRGRLEAVRSYLEQRSWRKAGASLEAAALLQPDRPEIDILATQIALGQRLGQRRQATSRGYSCPGCGIIAPAQAKFCDNCGTRLSLK